jgi:hypothetical protein
LEGLALLYETCGFQGIRGAINSTGSYNMWDLPTLGIRNDAISALKIAPGYELVLYENANFMGRNVTYVGDVPCLSDFDGGLDNQGSSMILRHASTVANTLGKSIMYQSGTAYMLTKLGRYSHRVGLRDYHRPPLKGPLCCC